MSTFKKIHQEHGFYQEDMVELMYYFYTGYGSILTYLSTLGRTISTLIGCISAANGSGSLTVLSISGLASFPVSMTTLNPVSINLREV